MSGRRYYFEAEHRYRYNSYSVDGVNNGDANKVCYDYDPLYPSSNKNNRNEDNSNNKRESNSNGNSGTKDEAEPEREPEADKDDDSEILQDVHYSSSSIDRSSIGSIPWADDAIKKNKLDWERVDRIVSGAEVLPEQEAELRDEIADWQRKFPNLVAHKAKPLKQESFEDDRRLVDNAAEIDSLSDLTLNSVGDYEEQDEVEDGFLTPTSAQHQRLYQRQRQHPLSTSRACMRSNRSLVGMVDRDLRITSVALKLRKREFTQGVQTSHEPTTLTSSTPQSATVTRSRLCMPPILNVLDSNRRFRGLLNNRSFVQLTQVQQQQPKSAALTYASSAESRQQTGIRSAWHMPMAATRFLNNRHAIVLPALNRHRDFSTSAAMATMSSSNGGRGSSNSSIVGGISRRNAVPLDHHHQQQEQKQFGQIPSSNAPSTGRSISAAIQHPCSEFATNSAFYIPYSASKFKAFK